MSGYSQGLSLYERDTDPLLYKAINFKPIDTNTINFDDINKKLDENYSHNDNLYNNAKSSIAGYVAGVDKTLNDTGKNLKNSITEFINDGKNDIIQLFGIGILFLVLLKK